MADTQKDREHRARRADDAYDSTRTGDDPSFVAVNTLPTKETTTTTGPSPSTDSPLSRTVGEKLHETGKDVREAVGVKPGAGEERPRTAETVAAAMGLPPRASPTGTTRDVDWDQIQHPGMEPCDEPYGTRPVSELAPPPRVQDKADLAAIRMMGRDREERDRLERQRVAATGMTIAAVTRAATTRTESTTTGETTGTEPATGERTTRAGAALGTGRSRTEPEDESIHQDWETQPQINAPQDAGAPTTEGQDGAARLRGGENEVPVDSSARRDVTDDRSVTEKIRDRARDVKEEIDRKV